MSKYIKLEDAEKLLTNALRIAQGFDEPLEKSLVDLPTIEVSEDCISKHDIWKIIEDNAYWVRYNENSTKKGMTLTGINQALNECPPVIPTVSEDCISKGYLEQEIENQTMTVEKDKEYWRGWNNALDKVVELIENAPSVVPTTEQSSKVGEWHRVSADKYVQHAYHHFRCSECGEDTIGEPNYCPNCGAQMRLE